MLPRGTSFVLVFRQMYFSCFILIIRLSCHLKSKQLERSIRCTFLMLVLHSSREQQSNMCILVSSFENNSTCCWCALGPLWSSAAIEEEAMLEESKSFFFPTWSLKGMIEMHFGSLWKGISSVSRKIRPFFFQPQPCLIDFHNKNKD